MKKLVGIILIVLGVVLLAATGIRTLAQQSKSAIEVSVPSSGTFVYTSPGVLGMAGDTATVTFTGEGIIQWGFGNEDDVVAYVGESAASALTGVASATEAEVKTSAASAAAAAADAKQIAAGGFNLQHSDLWLQAGEGEGKAVAELTLEPGTPRAIVATTSTGVAPEMTVRWDNVPLSKPIPFLALSLLVLLFGLLLVVQEIQDEINAPATADSAEKPVEKRDRSFDLTEVIFPFGKSAAKQEEEKEAEAVGNPEDATDLDAESSASGGSVSGTDNAADTGNSDSADSTDGTNDAGVLESADGDENEDSSDNVAPQTAPAVKSGNAWRSLWEFPDEPVAKPEPTAESATETDQPAEDEDA